LTLKIVPKEWAQRPKRQKTLKTLFLTSAVPVMQSRFNVSPMAGIALLIAAIAIFSALDTTTNLVTSEMHVLLAVWTRWVNLPPLP
jgi:hypothetical protein